MTEQSPQVDQESTEKSFKRKIKKVSKKDLDKSAVVVVTKQEKVKNVN